MTSRLDRIWQAAEARLLGDLPRNLHYHGPQHTLADVIPAVHRLSKGENIAPSDLELLLVAALYHDMGFIESYNGNEQIGARMAAEAMPEYGYGPAEINRVINLILATELKEIDGVWRQDPGSDLLKQILCDADLDNLGREDFFDVSDALRQELLEQGKRFEELEWLTRQILFISQQEWFTRTQREHRQQEKARNVAKLRRSLAALL
ncbi:MAG TPA: phosphohydrolase [Fibrobacteria bacterium]|nr:phosphohydrolase [Fibrobacteria bacterium]